MSWLNKTSKKQHHTLTRIFYSFEVNIFGLKFSSPEYSIKIVKDSTFSIGLKTSFSENWNKKF